MALNRLFQPLCAVSPDIMGIILGGLKRAKEPLLISFMISFGLWIDAPPPPYNSL